MRLFDLPLSDTRPTRFSESEIADFALRTGWIDDIGVVNPASTVIERRPLSWWPGHNLIVACDPLWAPTMAAWVLKDGERLVRLDGRSPPIHALNAKSEPVFTADNAIAYVGFFCTFVHGDDGPFAPIRSLEDQILPVELDREKIAEFIRDPVILKQEPAGENKDKVTFHIESLIYYADTLFLSNFVLGPTGMMEMVADEELVTGLGTSIKMPLRFVVTTASIDSKDKA